jgi:hypothetical protein
MGIGIILLVEEKIDYWLKRIFFIKNILYNRKLG